MSGHKGAGLHMLTFILLAIGGLNWLAYALFNWEIGTLVGGMDSIAAKVIYILIGLSAIYELATHKHNCKNCGEKSADGDGAPMGDGQTKG